jgi:REP-associated tyrosine transposase
MPYDPNKHHRHAMRLQGYDYSREGAYYVTICVLNRESLFGTIVDDEMRLQRHGEIVEECWQNLPQHYPTVELDEFVIMPNHVHGIVIVTVGAGLKPAPTNNSSHGLPEIMRGFKTFSARRINEMRGTPGVSAWQRSYYEHIIRNENDLNRIRAYIVNNPARWASDEENTANPVGKR